MGNILFGGTGYIGSHVAEQLHLSGQAFTAVVRTGADTTFLQRLGARIVTVDFNDKHALETVIHGHERVYNCLADVRLHDTLANMHRVGVDLTGRVFQATARAGARRFVQLSTVEVYGFARPPIPIDEDYPCTASFPFNQGHIDRERNLLALAAGSPLELVLVRPVHVHGPRDKYLSQLVRQHRQGRFAVIGTGTTPFSWIDPRDTGRAMLWLGEYPDAAGHTWLVRHSDTCMLEIKHLMDTLSGRPSKLVRLPAPLASGLARVLEWVTPYGKPLALTRCAIAVVTTPALFNDSRMRATGFTCQHTLQATIEDALKQG